MWPTYLITGFMAVGGNFAARRSALEAIGGFDTSIAFYGEDANIARRLGTVGKVSFRISLYMATSGRRLKAEGLFTMAYRYSLNFLSEALLKKPATVSYKDIR
jgi:GT2 family glycosyltransferase